MKKIKVSDEIAKMFMKLDILDAMADKCVKHKHFKKAFKYQYKTWNQKTKSWTAVRNAHPEVDHDREEQTYWSFDPMDQSITERERAGHI